MALNTYSTGTVSVTTGGAVTVAGGIWGGPNVVAGDMVSVDGGAALLINDVADATHGQLVGWSGGAVSGKSYIVYKCSSLRFDDVQMAEDAKDIVAALNTEGFYHFVPPGASEPDPSLGDDGQYAFQATTGNLWVKYGGLWVFVGVYKGINPRGTWNSGISYAVNDVVSFSGNSYMAIAANTNSQPPSANWMTLGTKGDKGDIGISYGGSSYSTNEIPTSLPTSLTFGMSSANLAYAVGTRVRFTPTSLATVYVEGVIDAIAVPSGSLYISVLVDRVKGTGSYTGWNASVAGDVGLQGPQGEKGNKGDTGDQGTGLQPDATGTVADKASHDGEAKGFVFLQTDVVPFQLWVKASATSGDWDGPTPISDEERAFGTKSEAESYSFIVAPEWIRTLGLATIGDGGEGVYRSDVAGTDLTISLRGGGTQNYSLLTNNGVRPQQAAVIGNVDDRNAFQEMFDKLRDGDTFHFPGWATANIVNGVGTGANAWAQRADAVANNGLRAITCNKNNITVVFDGSVTMATPLDDLFRFSGARVAVRGNGKLKYTGTTFIDTSAPGDDTLQWRPTVVKLSGDDSSVEGIWIDRPPAIGIWLPGNRQTVRKCRITGGPTVYQPNGPTNASVLFGVFCGLPDGSASVEHKIIDCYFGLGDDGGRLYDSVFSKANHTMLMGNHHRGLWEHALYSYGISSSVNGDHIINCASNAIQIFNQNAQVQNCAISNCSGGIQLMRFSFALINGNYITNMVSSAIAARTFDAATDGTSINSVFSNNTIFMTGAGAGTVAGSGIDIFPLTPFKNIDIYGNVISGGATGQTAGGIFVGTDPSASSPGASVNVHDNIVTDTDGYGIAFNRVSDFSCKNNRIGNANGAAGTTAIFGKNTTNGDVDGNLINDNRTTAITALTASFVSATGNASVRARNNNIKSSAASGSSISVPSDGFTRDNSINGVMEADIG
jgi:hypothetical protein